MGKATSGAIRWYQGVEVTVRESEILVPPPGGRLRPPSYIPENYVLVQNCVDVTLAINMHLNVIKVIKKIESELISCEQVFSLVGRISNS